MSNFRGAKNAGWYGSNLSQPIKIWCNFIVDSANGNGLGIRSLKSNGWIRNVFMNTSASFTGDVANTSAQITNISPSTSSLLVGMPVQGTAIPAGSKIISIDSSTAVTISAAATGDHTGETITYQGFNNGLANPNPAAGYAWVQFKQNFNLYLGGTTGFVSQLSGSNVNIDASDAALTPGAAYVITVLGTSTAADWLAVGVPAGVTPAVGVAFIAAASGAGTGTGKVQIPVASGSGISVVDVIGNTALADNSSIASNGGLWVLARFLAPTVPVTSGTAGNAVTLNSGTTLEATGGGSVPVSFVATAPADGAVVGMSFEFDQSSADPIMANGDPVGA